MLKTRLTDIERRYIEGRLSEEQAALQHHTHSFPSTALDCD
jgi:hypothetical protein